MKNDSYGIDRWYVNVTIVIVLAALILSIGMTMILLFVSDMVSDKLMDLTVGSVLQSQSRVADQIVMKIADIPASLGSILDRNELTDSSEASEIYARLNYAIDEIKALHLITYNQNGQVSSVSTSSIYDQRIENLINSDSESKRQFFYGDNMILSIGSPYKDRMGIHTMIPVYITYYNSSRKVATILMEMDISMILYDLIDETMKKVGEYQCSIYNQDYILMETTRNYMRITVETLSMQNTLELSTSERQTLIATSKLYRVVDDRIELFSLCSNGFILKGEVSTSYIEQMNGQIRFIIISISLTSIVMLLLMGGLLLHARKTRMNTVRMAVETIQAKLDPHFLFNTLNSMVGLAAENENERLMKGFKALSQFLRSSISTELYVTLQDEVTMLDSYFDIQRLRYGETFTNIYDIEDKVYDCIIPRFTIQPIVENCFIHAGSISPDEKIEIRIKAFSTKQKRLHIIISNNGQCSDEDVENVRRSLNSFKRTSDRHGLGLSLINHELKLIYGKKYGLDARRTEEGLFEVEIIVPEKLSL